MLNAQKIFALTNHRLPPATATKRGWGRNCLECLTWCKYFRDDYDWHGWPGRARFWSDKVKQYQRQYERELEYRLNSHTSDPMIENELNDRGLEEQVQQCYIYQYKQQDAKV